MVALYAERVDMAPSFCYLAPLKPEG